MNTRAIEAQLEAKSKIESTSVGYFTFNKLKMLIHHHANPYTSQPDVLLNTDLNNLLFHINDLWLKEQFDLYYSLIRFIISEFVEHNIKNNTNNFIIASFIEKTQTITDLCRIYRISPDDVIYILLRDHHHLYPSNIIDVRKSITSIKDLIDVEDENK